MGPSVPNRPGFLLTLRDASELFVGPVLPEDSWRLRDGLERMSARSRYLRFFTGLKRFSDDQVRYFTEVDQVNHVAWGALDCSKPRWPGVAIGRFSRLEDRPNCAEWAIAIVDDFQRRGLGRTLLAILYLEAEERRIDLLTGLVLLENHFVLTWLSSLGARINTHADAYEIELPINRRRLLDCGESGEAFAELLAELEPRVRAVRQSALSRSE